MLRCYLIPILVLSGCRGGNDTSDAAGDPDAEGTFDVTDADADGTVDAIDPDADTDSDADPADADAADTGEDTADGCIVPDTTSDAEDPDVAEDPTPDSTADSSDDDALDGDAADVALDDSTDEGGAPEDAPEADASDVTPDPDAPPFTCGGALVDARDGKSYATVLIGTQCWMAENLNLGTMILGTASATDDGTVQKHCYADDPASCDACGGLYQWDELMAYSPSDAGNPSTTRGICPSGWHVPGDVEFKTLEIALGMTAADADLANTWRGAGVGTAMKAGGSSGFEGHLCGRNAGGSFSLQGDYGYFLTSLESGSNAWRRCLSGTADNVGRWDTFPKTWSLSLRCVLD